MPLVVSASYSHISFSFIIFIIILIFSYSHFCIKMPFFFVKNDYEMSDE